MNPIKSSDLYQDDGALKKLVEDLKASETAAKKAMSEIRKEAEQLGNALNGVSGETVDQRAVIEATAKETDKLSKAYVRYQASLGDIGVQLQAVRNAQRDLNRVNRLEAKELAAKEGSYNQLSARLSLLKTRYKQLSQEERDNTKAGKELVKQINTTNEKLKDLDKQVGVTSRNVGNYKDSIKEAIDEMGQLPGAAGAAAGGIQGLGQAFKRLLANPIVLVLAVIVAGLAALFNAFKQSKSGAEALGRASAVLRGVLVAINGILANVAEGLIDAFSNPREAIIGLGRILQDQVINRFKALFNLGGALAKLLQGEFKQAAIEAADAAAQLVTGLEAGDRAKVAESFNKIKDQITETATAFDELYQAQLRVKSENRALTRAVERYTTAEEVAQSIVDDTTKSFKEREEAAERAREALEKRAKAEIRIARNNLGLVSQEIAIRRANGQQISDLLDGQISAYQALAQAERGLTLATRQNERERAELKQDRLERDLDILIDGFDNQKKINERLIKDDQLTFDTRRKILADTERLATESFAQQIATIQEFTGVQVNANELLAASDARVLNEKIRALGLSEIIEGRLLEIVRERRTAVQDLAEVQTELTQAEAQARIAAFQEQQKLLQQRRDIGMRIFEEQQALKESEFNLEERTEAEKTRFRIRAEIERLQKVLDLNERFGGELSQRVIQTYKNEITKLQGELENVTEGPGGFNLFKSLGFDFTGEQQQAITDSLSFAKDQLTEYIRVQKQLADQAVQEADRRVQAAQSALQAEISANQQGLASNVETRRQELEDAEAQQRKAVELQRKAARDERRIQTIQQAGNLVSASAKVFAQFGFPAALPIVALMFGAFAAAKLKAGQLAKQQQQFGAGGTGLFEGSGSHATGDHIAFGQSGNTSLVAEAGERWAIFRKDKTRKYGSTIPEVVDLLNAGRFEAVFQRRTIQNATAGIPFAPELHVNAPRTDMSRTEGYLQQIAKHGQRSEYIDAQGRRVVREGNVTTYYA